jgi:hypothetical protein
MHGRAPWRGAIQAWQSYNGKGNVMSGTWRDVSEKAMTKTFIGAEKPGRACEPRHSRWMMTLHPPTNHLRVALEFGRTRSLACSLALPATTSGKHMKTRRMSCTTSLLLGALVIGCVGAPTARSQVTNYQTPGNLESTQTIDCGEVSTLKNTFTPPDLYAGMVKCITQGNYAAAVYFFALAGTYSYFDGLRVADDSAHQAHSVLLQESLESVGMTPKTAFMQELQNTLGNHDKLPAVCRDIRRIGAPQYYPRYMVQHGMNAVLGSNTDDGLVPNFDADAAWKKALAAYLHCENS